MSSVSSEQKQILFGYCIGISTREESEQAQKLIAENKEASLLYSKMKAGLKPLDSIEMQIAPDDLVERTILRITNIPRPDKELNNLLEAEQNRKPVKIGFLRNFSEVAAIAAALIIFTGILVPTFGYARQKYFQQQCAMGMNSIYQGFGHYMADNNNKLPYIARAEGAPWWKIGVKGESKTAEPYLLIAQKYVDPEVFICKSCKNTKKIKITKEEFQAFLKKCQELNDFPDRRFVSYSFPIGCQKQSYRKMSCRQVLMGDRNPIFEKLPTDYSTKLTIELKHEWLKKNSSNHSNKGQNILFGDGRVEFLNEPQICHDYIFNIEDADIYHGNESPSCSTDLFLAP